MNRPTTAEEADPRTRIVAAARRVFAERGFDAATLREITELAQANLAAVNYYFRSKDDLIRYVLESGVRPLVEMRMAALEACVAAHGAAPPLEALVEALVRPLVEMGAGEHRDTLLILMQVRTDTDLQEIVAAHFTPLHERFVEVLGRVLPDLPRSEAAFRYDCARGATLQILVELAPAARLVDARGAADLALDELVGRLVRFIAGGFVADPPSPRRSARPADPAPGAKRPGRSRKSAAQAP